MPALEPVIMDEYLRVSVRDVLRQFSYLSDKCLSSPIVITKNGRDRLVLLGFDEFKFLIDAASELRYPPAEVDANLSNALAQSVSKTMKKPV